MEQEEAEAKGVILGGCLWVGEEEGKKQIWTMLNKGQLQECGGSSVVSWRLGKVRGASSFL